VPNLTRKRQHKVLVALGRAIKEARQTRGLSQEALALLAEVDRAHVGRVERGDSNAAVLTLAQIANALNVALSKLMQRAGL
jgi:transcriptional regulator with XRE-family HTH domain